MRVCQTVKLRLFWVLMAVLLFAPAMSVAAGNPDSVKAPYILGVNPTLLPSRWATLFAPVIREFSRALDRKVVFRTKQNNAQFVEELRKQTYDILFVNPFNYVLAHDTAHYLPLARYSHPLVAKIAVRGDSTLNTLEDLKGQVLALPPSDFPISVMVELCLLDEGFLPKGEIQVRHFNSNTSCLYQVLVGSAAACGTGRVPLQVFESKTGIKLRVIFETPTIPSSVFAVHERVPQTDRNILERNILSWPETEAGRTILKTTNWLPFVPAKDPEYEMVRRLLNRRM